MGRKLFMGTLHRRGESSLALIERQRPCAIAHYKKLVCESKPYPSLTTYHLILTTFSAMLTRDMRNPESIPYMTIAL